MNDPLAIYVGRPSKWGNPYKLTKEEDRNQVLIGYETWLQFKLDEDPHFLDELIDKNLVCFCPLNKKCHADILLNYVKKITDSRMIYTVSNPLIDKHEKIINKLLQSKLESF
jgi:hypothetical protein